MQSQLSLSQAADEYENLWWLCFCLVRQLVRFVLIFFPLIFTFYVRGWREALIRRIALLLLSFCFSFNIDFYSYGLCLLPATRPESQKTLKVFNPIKSFSYSWAIVGVFGLLLGCRVVVSTIGSKETNLSY